MNRQNREHSKQQAVEALLGMVPPGISQSGAPEDLTLAVVLAADEIVRAATARCLAERGAPKLAPACALSLRWAWNVADAE